MAGSGAARAVWLEAAVNGPWSRARQPGIPISVDEIVADGIACARAGAAIVHVHPYDVATGRQRDDPDIYQPIIEGIRAEVDAVVYPTLPLAGSPDAPEPMAPQERFAAVAELCRRGLLEWAVVDPGTTTLTHLDDLAAGRDGFVYLNPDAHVRFGLATVAAAGVRPAYACYEPGFTRFGAAIAAAVPGLPEPVYRFMFTEGFHFGFPPRRYALEAHRRLLADSAAGAQWMIAGLAVDVRPLIPDAVELGGHVRVGLEDAPFGCSESNEQLVRDAARRIEDAGGRVATAAEVRAALAA
ncbi:3-keto-5-aminohexanoate cleavage protein [Pseudonocardia sp.]|uniref:3-keto-5-aminohexanoate cleavage protein n=1 Tax=Pseudonocardia sp. TaxID=60912 RepID=UPI003D0E6245